MASWIKDDKNTQGSDKIQSNRFNLSIDYILLSQFELKTKTKLKLTKDKRLYNQNLKWRPYCQQHNKIDCKMIKYHQTIIN